MSGRDSRSAYETGRGRLCPRCGFTADDCHCSSRAKPPVPARIACALRLENVQGDQRERLRPLLAAKGWTVRG